MAAKKPADSEVIPETPLRADSQKSFKRDIVVVGASAGGVDALLRLTRDLPPSFKATVIVAMHCSAQSALDQILSKSAKLRVQWASDGAEIRAGNIYLAPPDRQLSLARGYFRVERSPKEGLYRPSINLLFRSAASDYGQRVVGLILTGALNDGIAGLWDIKRSGGCVIVQSPNDAKFPHMPESAIQEVSPDFVLPIHTIAEQLLELTQGDDGPTDPPESRPQVLIVEDEPIVADALEERLLSFGYRVSGRTASGEEAVTIAGRKPTDVVLMDIQLAGSITGIEAGRRIWEYFRIPVVYVTAFADPATFEQVNSRECYGYVAKPFHSKAIYAAVELAVKRHKKEMLLR
jgi:two-component system chemotaxis response regulator CheB